MFFLTPPFPPSSPPFLISSYHALYSGVVTANHLELLPPFYDLLDAAVAGGSPGLESTALGGCPGGIHLSVDLAPFGLKLGTYGQPQAWGIRSNAVYAGVAHSYQWAASDTTDPATQAWARNQAMPYLKGVAKFFECFLTKTPVPTAPDGYRYWSVGDCDGDEGCALTPAEATNPTWTITYLTRALETLISMAGVLGEAEDPAWRDMLTHLPPTPTTTYSSSSSGSSITTIPVLSAYGEGALNAPESAARSFHGQAGYLHALWPGETLSPMSEPNATLVAAALNTFNFTNWGQDNSFSWVYSAAARAGIPPDRILGIWRKELGANLKTNHLVAFGGLCSDSLGAMAFVHDMLMHSQEGFVRVFPAWPGNQSASFTGLRARGGVVVGGVYVGKGGATGGGVPGGRTGGTVNVTLQSLGGGGAIKFLSPWVDSPTSGVKVVGEGGESVAVSWSTVNGLYGGPVGEFTPTKGMVYTVTYQQ